MSGSRRIRVLIDRVRVGGGTRADAQSLAEALRASLTEQLQRGVPKEVRNRERISLNDPGGMPQEKGQVIGRAIADKLTGEGSSR